MATITLETICMRSDDIVSREIEGELIIVPIASGVGDMEDELYTLNVTGRDIWKRFDGKLTLRDIANDLATHYTAPLDHITRDVLGLTGELAKRKMLLCRE